MPETVTSNAADSILAGEDGLLSLYTESANSRVRRIDRFIQLWNKRRFIFWMGVVGWLVTLLVSFLIPSRYDSSVRLMPPDQKSSSSAAMMVAAMTAKAGGMPGIAQNLLSGTTTGALFVQVLESRTVADHLIGKFDLRKVYRERTWKAARETLAHRTKIEEDRKSGVIMLTVSDHDPRRAAAIATDYVAELNHALYSLSGSSAHQERVFLEQRLAQVNSELQISEKDLADFSSKNSAIDIKEQGRAMVSATASLEGELIAAQAEYQGLSQIYSSNNVRVRSLKARIDELKGQLTKFSSAGSPASSDGDWPYPTIRDLPRLGSRFADFYRKVQVEEAVFEALTKEYELAKVEEAREIPVVSVLDPADIPEKKTWPPRFLFSVIGSLFLTAAAIFSVSFTLAWREMEVSDPRKLFLARIAQDARRDFYRGILRSGGRV